MKRRIQVLVTVIFLFLFLTACSPGQSVIVGTWTLETLSAADGSYLAMGRAYDGYAEYDGEKKDAQVIVSKGGTLQLIEDGNARIGTYSLIPNWGLDREDEDNGTTAWTVEFEDGTVMKAVFGSRNVSDQSIQTLLLSDDDWIYMFLKTE